MINIKIHTFVTDMEEDGDGDEGMLEEEIVIDAGTEDIVLQDYPADCCPDPCYKRFPFLAGDDDAPFWQGWANLRLKTFQLIENKYFETAVITMILLSSLALVSNLVRIKVSLFTKTNCQAYIVHVRGSVNSCQTELQFKK